jgi:hypothetical protein
MVLKLSSIHVGSYGTRVQERNIEKCCNFDELWKVARDTGKRDLIPPRRALAN